MLLERGEWYDVERTLVRGSKHNVRGRAVFMRTQPVHCGYAPAVAGLESGKAVQRHRGDEVVADRALMLEEIVCHDRTDGVAPAILRIRSAATVAKEACDRIGAARLQLTTEHVTIAHAGVSRVGPLFAPPRARSARAA